MKKELFFDVETTGLDERECGLTQLAGIIVIDDKEVDSFNFRINPLTYNKSITINEQALQVTGLTMDDLKNGQDSKTSHQEFKAVLTKYVNPFDKTDKFTCIGYNSSFDMRFLISWFDDLQDKYFGSFFQYKDVDVFALWKILRHIGKVPILENDKLGTVCSFMGIDLTNAHDALDDIRATRNLYLKLIEYFK